MATLIREVLPRQKPVSAAAKPLGSVLPFSRRIFSVRDRVFDETLFRIFAKHEIHENAPVFREIFASFASFAQSNFRDFRVSRKL